MAYIDVSAVSGVTLLAGIDPDTRDMFLSAATVGQSINPIDIYKEMRTCRNEIEALRPYDVFLSAFGNVPTGGGAATPRYVRCNAGTRIVPYDITHELTVIGTVITDDGQSGVACFDRTPLNASTVVDINYQPPQVEIITVNTGSGVSAQDITDISVAVWNYTTRVLTSAGAGGATAQEVWEYATRELTSSAGVTAQDISDIADAVWDEALSAHTSVGSTGEKLNDSAATVDTGAIATAVWASPTRELTSDPGPDAATIATAVWNNVSRSLTTAAGVTPQDILDISTQVWSETTRELTSSTAPTESEIADAVWTSVTRTLTASAGPDAATISAAVWSETTRALTEQTGLTTAESNQLMAIPTNPVLDSDIRLDRGMTAAQEAKLDALPTAASIATAVWTETVRSITNAAAIDTASINAITAQVWAETTRSLTESPGVTAQDIIDITNAVWNEDGRSVEVTLSDTSMLTSEQARQLKELWQVEGLDSSHPMTVTRTSRTVDAINQVYSGDRRTSTTATRL